MKTKHTPGPWKHIGADETGVQLIRSPDGESTIASTGGWLEELADEETANARLITAAPDLLEALQMMLLWTGDIKPSETRAIFGEHRGPPTEAQAVAIARAAIAKASTPSVPLLP